MITNYLNPEHLSEQDIESAKQYIITQINAITDDAIIRHAIASNLAKASDAVKTDYYAPAAIQQAKEKHSDDVKNGTHFKHCSAGSEKVTTTREYDYSIRKDWTTLKKQTEAAKKVYDEARKQQQDKEKSLVAEGKVSLTGEKYSISHYIK